MTEPVERGEERVADKADYDPNYDPNAPIICEICGAHMVYTGACKIKCRNCGKNTRDCSDP